MLFSPSVIWLDLILKERHFLFPRELEQVMFYEKKKLYYLSKHWFIFKVLIYVDKYVL